MKIAVANKIAQRFNAQREKWRRNPPINILDRYLIKKFIGTYFFSILLIIAIVIVFDFNEKIDKLTVANKEFGISWGRIFVDYYLNTIPYFANLFSSLFVFISVIFFTSKLADRSEIIAMRSNGMSFKRILRPYIISALLIGLLNLVLGAYIIPHSNKIRTNFENKYIKKRQITMVDNVQLQVDTGVIAFFSSFNIQTKSGSGFCLDKFRNKKLVSHLTALRVQYDTIADRRYQWRIYNYNIRQLRGMHEKVTSGLEMDTIIAVEPQDLLYTRNQQETMTTPEISEYIDKQRMRGSASVSTFEVEYHKRFASAFAALILTIIGVSLSCEKRKGGMGLSLGLGLALSFGYILFQTISASFATNGGWPPMLAVWIPNIIFSIVAFILYRRTPR
ncbi:MAG: LptF/LptG family permease [Bacteroidaceae bacterium]|nr:LptF/LptG family permease [Bacteroidaceae bacterium]